VFWIAGCAVKRGLTSEQVETATRQTVVEEIERVHRSEVSTDLGSAAEYLRELEDRLKFLDPYFTASALDAETFRAGLREADFARSKADASDADAARRSRLAPEPGAILTFSEREVRRHLELLDRGEFSGGYSDEDLAAYGSQVFQDSRDPSGNLTAREEFRKLLRMRLCDFYPEWGQTGREAIVEGRIFPGMSREAVIASWGYPASMEKLDYAGVQDEVWRYEGSRVILIRDGRFLKALQ
jgi:hypothetical protein